MSELHDLTAVELLEQLRTRRLSAVEIAEHTLERAAADSTGAFASLDPERALARARAVDRGEVTGVLAGIPTADKDLHERSGQPLTYGSARYRGHSPGESDALTQQLDRAGLISIGSTATPEFGFTNYTRSRLRPPTTVPGRPDLNAGGSSGGAAAAVAARILPVAPGSDAGGSIRIPAACCGIIGMKPSRGRVAALSGQDALGGLPVAGPLARTVGDAALLLDALCAASGPGPAHPFALRAPEERESFFPLTPPPAQLRIGVLTAPSPWEELTAAPLSPEAIDARDAGAAACRDAGCEVVELAMPHLPGYAEAFMTLWQANASALAPAQEADTALTRWLIAEGARLRAPDIVAAHRRFAEFERTIIAAFDAVDLVLTPTLALPPRPAEWPGDLVTGDPMEDFREQCRFSPHTSMVNVAGLPAISLPISTRPDGLTMSIQLIGRPGADRTCVAAAGMLTGEIAP